MTSRPGTDSDSAESAAHDPELLKEVARQIVAEVEPDELAIFEESAQAYLEDPEAVARGSREEAVGFGLELAALTPVAMDVAKTVLQALAGIIVASITGQAGAPTLRELLRSIVRGGVTRPASPASLSPPRLQELHDVAKQRAVELGVPTHVGESVADALISRLVRGGAADASGRGSGLDAPARRR